MDRNLNVDCFGAAAASIQDGDNNEIVQAATVIDATGSAGRVARSFFESAMPIGAKSPARREDIHSHQGVHAASNVTIVESGAHRDSSQWPSIGAAKRFFVGIGLLDDGYMLNRSDGLKNHTMVGKKWICRKVDEKINQVNHPVIRQKAIYESHNEEILKVSGGKYSIAPFQSFGVRDFIAQLKHIGLTDASISSLKFGSVDDINASRKFVEDTQLDDVTQLLAQLAYLNDNISLDEYLSFETSFTGEKNDWLETAYFAVRPNDVKGLLRGVALNEEGVEDILLQDSMDLDGYTNEQKVVILALKEQQIGRGPSEDFPPNTDDIQKKVYSEIKNVKRKKMVKHQAFLMQDKQVHQSHFDANGSSCHRIGDAKETPRYWEGEGLDNALNHINQMCSDLSLQIGSK